MGQVSGDGHLVLHDNADDSVPLNLDLVSITILQLGDLDSCLSPNRCLQDCFLAKMPRKTFVSDRTVLKAVPFAFPHL